jgi:hypothetical protein
VTAREPKIQTVLVGGKRNGETRNRTGDTTIFSRVLYQLSYLARVLLNRLNLTRCKLLVDSVGEAPS